MDENRGGVGDPWVGRSSGAVGFALTSILSQGGEEVASLPRFWIPVPYRGTGQALRWNDEISGESLSRIGVREVPPCQYGAGPGLESIRSCIRV